jgi:hypothetical protein
VANRRGLVVAAGLVLLVAGCGSVVPAAKPVAAPPTTTTIVKPVQRNGALAQQWISGFCAPVVGHAVSYAAAMVAAQPEFAGQETASDRGNDQATMLSLVSGLVGEAGANTATVHAASATDPGDVRAKTVLLGVYAQVQDQLGTDEQQTSALPVGDATAFSAAFAAVGNDVVAVMRTAEATVKADPELGAAFTANSSCGSY